MTTNLAYQKHSETKWPSRDERQGDCEECCCASVY